LKLHPSATFIFEHHSLITVQPHITTTLILFYFISISLGTGVDGETEDWWRTKWVKCQPALKSVG